MVEKDARNKQKISALSREAADDPPLVAQFFVGAQTCLVFQRISQVSDLDSETGMRVGEMKIAGERYVIVVPKEASLRPSDPATLARLLTKRELQIIGLVAEGLVNKQIADKLKISEWTVSTHLRRIFAKLGVDSRASMVYRCAGLIDMHPEMSWDEKKSFLNG